MRAPSLLFADGSIQRRPAARLARRVSRLAFLGSIHLPDAHLLSSSFPPRPRSLFSSRPSAPSAALKPDADAVAARVRSKLDFVSERLDRDEDESADELVKHSLDRLAFASQVSNVQSAFGAVGHDALDEMGSLANKATETVATFQASQYAAKWMPVDTHLTMKP